MRPDSGARVGRTPGIRRTHGHTIPSLETLEKLARALEVPLYQIFYEGEKPPELRHLMKRKTAEEVAWGRSGAEAHYLNKLRSLLGRMKQAKRKLLFDVARKMVKHQLIPSLPITN